ncbi:chromatin modification protein [Starmerella bacillaris]|uniref:Chromatin modification protein n=1 Tax=Starmerella bacillaris TaxID=1247836 RepID=A0AAV5RQT9_STABA|nr:chromatin modification protein [Starmerella bacillaris]
MNINDQATPRDVKIVHLILASMGITSYQDQVSVQLLDFAYRYTSQVLQDAVIYSDYAHQSGVSQPAGVGPQSPGLTIDDLKLAVASQVAYQFKPTTPKDLLLSLAAERNKRTLPPVPTSYGLRLPPEKYCLTGLDRDIDDDDDVIIAGYEKMDITIPEAEQKEDVEDRSADDEKMDTN